MNTERLECLAVAVMTNHEKHFHMGNHYDCLMGFTKVMSGGEALNCISGDVADYLGLDDEQRKELFFPNYGVRNDEGRQEDLLDHIGREDAAAVVRHLAATGKVVWALRFPIEKWS